MNSIPAGRLRLCAPGLIVAALGALLLPLYRYQINQDAITYISIAQKYARAEWADAVNGHAYPLISWLMAPVLLTGLDPLLTAKLVNLAIGMATVVALGAVCLRAGLNRQYCLLCQLCAIPGVVYFAYTVVTPDLLLAAVLLVYHFFLLSPSYSRSIRYGIACGFIGGLAYLTKSYCLPFFLVHFPLINCWYYFKSTDSARKTIIANFLAGMAVFLIICAGWSSVISMKYGRATASNQGSVFMSAMSPHQWEGPDHLIEPPNTTAVSIWEDPHEAFTQQYWSPFQSHADFKYWLKFIIRNLNITLWTFFIFSPFGCIVCLWLICSVLLRRQPERTTWITGYSMITSAIFAGGYCLLIAEERYLWPLFFLFVLLSMIALFALEKTYCFKNRVVFRSTLLILCLSFAVMPGIRLYQYINTGQEHAERGRTLSAVIEPGSKLVFDTNWFESLFLTFHLQSQIYGTADNIPGEKLEEELQRCAIDYFILWNTSPEHYPFLDHAREISANDLDELQIFKLTHR